MIICDTGPTVYQLVCSLVLLWSPCVKDCAEQEQSDPEWNGITLEWKWVDNTSRGMTLALARVLCLDLLLCVWLHISEGLNCCQEFRRGVVYRLIGVRIDIKDINNFNLWTKELGCNYWSTYTKSGIEGVQVTSLYHDPIGVDNRSLGVKFSNNIEYKRNYFIKWLFFCHMTLCLVLLIMPRICSLPPLSLLPQIKMSVQDTAALTFRHLG